MVVIQYFAPFCSETAKIRCVCGVVSQWKKFIDDSKEH